MRDYSIQIQKVEHSRVKEVDFDNIIFGRVFSDHMLTADYINGEWTQPIIQPFANISVHPATAAFHYGQAIFEGMKAYKDQNGNPVLFRPEENWKRMNESAERMCMVPIPREIFINGLIELIKLDQNWIPTKAGSSLYIRPFLIATDEYVGIKPSDNFKFMIFTSPVNAYYPEPIAVKIEETYSRAAQGGVGAAKTAGNYAASLYPSSLAAKEGYRQLIWTDAKEHKYIEESGTMNVFFIIDGVIITPDTKKDTILKGITRKSVIQLAKDLGYVVEERPIEVDEVIKAAKENRLTDVFGAGTAATIAHVSAIGYGDDKYTLPPVASRTISNSILQHLDSIKIGKIEDKYNWLTKIL